MLNRERAVAAVMSRIGQLDRTGEGCDWEVLPDLTLQRAFGWIVFCGPRRPGGGNSLRKGIAGQRAFIVERSSGKVVLASNGHPGEDDIAEYAKHLDADRD